MGLAKEYEDYVANAIPLSHRIAENDSFVRENEVFSQMLGRAQSHMSTASTAAANFATLTSALRDLKDLAPGGAVALGPTLTQYLISTQMLAHRRAVVDNTERFREIATRIPTEKDRQFNLYDVGHIDFHVATNGLGLPNGVIIPLIGWDAWSMAAALVYDLYQIISSAIETAKIKALAERLEREKVNTSQYQDYARASFRALRPIFVESFALYDDLAKTFDEWIAKVPTSELQSRHNNLKKLLDQFTNDAVAAMRAAASGEVFSLLKSKDDVVNTLKISIEANVRIIRNLADLQGAGAASRLHIVQELLADVSLSDVLDLESTKKLVPAVLRALGLSSPDRRRDDSYDIRAELEIAIGTQVELSRTALAERTNSKRDLGTANSFSEALRILGPSEKVHESGTFTNDMDGFTQFDRTALIGDYQRTTGSSLKYSGPDPSAWPNTFATVVENFGTMGALASQGAIIDLKASLSALRVRDQQFSKLREALPVSRTNYVNTTVKPAIAQANHALSAHTALVENQLKPILANGSGLPDPKPVQLPPTPGSEVASPAVQEHTSQIGEGPLDLSKWELIENAWTTYQLRNEVLSAPDREALRQLYARYFGDNGLILAKSIPKYSEIISAVGTRLRSDPKSVLGREIRFGLNRAFAVLKSDSGLFTLGGAISLLAAADQASAEGFVDDSHRLLAAVDVALGLGLIPPLAAINDAGQIIHGLVTGYDYTGHKMTTADFLFRSVSFVLNLTPGAKLIVTIAGQRISKSLLTGVRHIRSLNVGAKIHELMIPYSLMAVHFASDLGEWLPEELSKQMEPPELAQSVMQLAQPEAELALKANRFSAGEPTDTQVLGLVSVPKNGEGVVRGSTTDVAYNIPSILEHTASVLEQIRTDKVLDLKPTMHAFLFDFCLKQTPPLRPALYLLESTVVTKPLADALRESSAIVYDIKASGLVLRPL